MPLFLAPETDRPAAAAIARARGGELAELELREFPDGEVYVRIDTPLQGETVWIVASLHPPREKLLDVFLLASTARDLGARRVGLVAPYLAYLRQDSRFRAGEGITSAYVGAWLSSFLDEVIAVEPHLHRYGDLREVYGVPARAVQVAPRIADWIQRSIEAPVVVGPDAESHQWARRVAAELGCPAVVLDKDRRGDRDVSIRAPNAEERSALAGRTPVLVDDIISTGRTMLEAVGALRESDARPPVCVGIHAVFADPGLTTELSRAGVTNVVTCNTIPHPTNQIDVTELVAAALHD